MKKVLSPLTLIVAVLLAIDVATVLFFVLHKKPLSIFPQNDTYFEFVSMTDEALAEGSTQGDLVQTDSLISYDFQLDSLATDPFAMLVFHDQELVRSYSLTAYDTLHFKLAPSHSGDFSVTLYLYIPGFSDPAFTNTHRPYRFDITTQPGDTVISLPLDDFATPIEWFVKNKTTEEQLGHTDWSKFTHLTIRSHKRLTTPQRFAFEDISFKQSHTPILLASFFVGILIFLILLYLFINKQELHQESLSPVFSRKHNPDDEARLLAYIDDYFGNPFFSLQMIQKELGLNHFQVNSIIENTHQKGYKAYLQDKRISKACNLLTTTDLPINTIAESVGYVHPNSFSRTFKHSMDTTPLSYRKDTKKA